MSILVRFLGLTLLMGAIFSCSSGSDSDSTQQAVSVTGDTQITLANKAKFTLSGICTIEGAEITITLETFDPLTTNCTDLTWAVSVPVAMVNQISENTPVSLSVVEAGNSTPASGEVRKDITAPTIAIATDLSAINKANQGSYTVSGTCSENAATVTVSLGSQTDQTTTCEGTSWSFSNYNAAGTAGSSVSIAASIKDQYENSRDAISVSVLRDIVASVVSITGTSLHINKANERNYTPEGGCEADGGSVSVTVATLSVQSLSCGGGNTWSLPGIDTSSLLAGTGHSLVVSQADSAGNVGSVTETFEKDITVPTVTITTSELKVNLANKSSFTIAGSCSENDQKVGVTIGSEAKVEVNCASGSWTYPSIDLSDGVTFPEGTIAVSITHEDKVGNEVTLSGAGTELDKDTRPPILALSSDPLPSINVANEGGYVFAGNCTDSNGNKITITVAGLNTNYQANCDTPWTSASVDLSGLVESARINVTVKVEDGHGNPFQIDTYFVKDVTAPTPPSGVSLHDPTASPAEDLTPEIAVSGVESNARVELYSDSGCSTSVSSSALVASSESSITIVGNALSGASTVTYYARQTDPAGNTSPCSSANVSYALIQNPLITQVGVGGGSYATGSSLKILVTFNENVTVVNTSGNPRISLTIGESAKYATYESGTGTSELTFTYTIEESDRDNDGISFDSPIETNGGTIRNASSRDAVLTFELPEDRGKVFVNFEENILISDGAFVFLRSGGSVVTWGNRDNGANSSTVSTHLNSGVIKIFSISSDRYGAFAALKDDGSVVTWGDSRYGGNSSTVSDSLSSGVTEIFSTRKAFAALKGNGPVVTWGDSVYGGSSTGVATHLSSGVTKIFSTARAFAALKGNGPVVTWGDSDYGGSSTDVSGSLSTGVTKIFSTDGAFAALKTDGRVVTWGHSSYGGSSTGVSTHLGSGVTKIFSTDNAFAALKGGGPVVTWGNSSYGGSSTGVVNLLSSGVTKIFSTWGAFAALKTDGRVVTWGHSRYGGNSSTVSDSLSSGVTKIFSTARAFAALKGGGPVVTWGTSDYGGVSTAVSTSLNSGVTKVFSTERAFAALKGDGLVATWGPSRYGGDSTGVSSFLERGVTKIFSSKYDFAALKSDGTVVTWGPSRHGGDSAGVSSLLSSGVTKIFSTESAFAALKDNGRVVTWGGAGGDSTAVSFHLLGGVSKIFSTKRAFAALKDNGSVVTWGPSNYGGVSTAVTPSLNSGVTKVFSTANAFAALKNDGSVVTWGDSNYGGNSTGVSLSTGVSEIFSTGYAFAALKENGSVVTWGDSTSGGNSTGVSLSTGVTKIFSTYRAFAALKGDGPVVTWGNSSAGGDSTDVVTLLSSEVTEIFSTGSAFAALKTGGSVVTWGNSYVGGSYTGTSLSSGVTEIFSTEGALAALKGNGSVVTWGIDNYGGNSSGVSLGSGVSEIFSTERAFAALKGDGSVVTWGDSGYGGNSSGVSGSLGSGVTKIFSTERAFAALKIDGSVVTWGASRYGGNSTAVSTSLSEGVSEIFSTQKAFAALKSDGSVVTWDGTIPMPALLSP